MQKQKNVLFMAIFPVVVAVVMIVKMDELNWLYSCVYVCLRARSLTRSILWAKPHNAKHSSRLCY